MTRNRKPLFNRYPASLTTPTKYSVKLVRSSFWYVIPLLLLGASLLLCDLVQQFEDEIYHKQPTNNLSPWSCLSELVLARWWHPVASSDSEVLDLLYRAMHAVLYRRITMAIKTARKVGVFVDCCLFACCLGGRWGNAEQVVAWCQR